MDPIPFYVVKDFWDYAALAAMAIGAIGSAFAAGVALWLGVVQHRPRANAWVGLSVYLLREMRITRDFVQFRLANTGSRSIVVNAISWHVGKEKVSMLQLVEEDLGEELPCAVPPDAAESWGAWLRPSRQEPLLDSLARDFLMPNWRKRLDSLHVRFHTAIGTSYTAQLDAKLRAAFIEACERVEATKAAEEPSSGPAAPTAGTS